jgi:hypothetical protein
MAGLQDTSDNPEMESEPEVSLEDRIGNLVLDEMDNDEVEEQDDDTVAPAEDTDDSPDEIDVESEDEAEDSTPETPAPRKLKLPDGSEVDEEEAVKGHLRQSDYTRKTQELSERRKAVEAKEASIEAERQKYEVLLDRLEAQTQMGLGDEPDWEDLAKNNPAEYVRKQSEWMKAEKRLATIEAERTQMQRQRAEVQERNYAAYLEAQEQQLLEALPAWKDAEVRSKEIKQVREYGLKAGFNEQELSTVADFRAVMLLRKAMLYDAAKARVSEKKARNGVSPAPQGKVKPKMATPGTAVTKGVAKGAQVKASRDSLRKHGDVESAVRLLDLLGID